MEVKMKIFHHITLQIAGLISTSVLAASVASAQVTFSDGTFNNADWSLISSSTGTGFATQNQVLTGGNPGAYLNVTLTSNNDWTFATSLMKLAQYDPQTQGAITNLSESFDNIQYGIVGAFGQGVAPDILQNGVVYFDAAYDDSNPTSWTTLRWNDMQASSFITESDFLNNNYVDHPNFSSSGSVITFGFGTGNSPFGDRVTGTGFDNFEVEINTPQATPEPGSVALFLSWVIGGGLLRRRNKRVCRRATGI
jgi:hypothetical protein